MTGDDSDLDADLDLDRDPALDPLCQALRYFVHRDRGEAMLHVADASGWTPITIELATRLRALNERHGLWEEEPDIIRDVLDGPGL